MSRSADLHLLAHELTHVVQQRNGGGSDERIARQEEDGEETVLDNGIVTEDTEVRVGRRRVTLRQGTYVEVLARHADDLLVRAYSGHGGRRYTIPRARFLHQTQITNSEGGAPRDDIGFARIEGDLYGPSGRPQPEDIDQGEVGDCYLMSAMFGVAQTSPQSIMRIIRTGQVVTRGDIGFLIPYDNSYEVTFFANDQGRRARPITVDNHFPVRARRGRISRDLIYAGDEADTLSEARQRPLWPLVLEKAYAEYRNGYPMIDSGRSPDESARRSGLSGLESRHVRRATTHAFIALTGRPVAEDYDPGIYEYLAVGDTPVRRSDANPLRILPDQMLERFDYYLEHHIPVVLGTPEHPVVGDSEELVDDSRGAPRLFTRHAYSLRAVDVPRRHILLYNPWSEDDRHRGPSVHPPPLTPEQVQRYFNQIITRME